MLSIAIIDKLPPLLAACSLASACSILSVFVISRRWAFIGEGISHSGFGGAGTVWLLMLAFPSIEHSASAAYVGVVVFSLATGGAIGYFTRSAKLNTDAIIGIFMVAALAWGFLAQQVFRHVRNYDPVGWQTFLFGQMDVSLQFALASAAVCAAVIGTVIVLAKEIVAYCFDPVMAQASGVRVGFIHYLLILLVTLTIVIGAKVAGAVMVTALLVLPGASALLLSKKLKNSVLVSLAVGLIGAVGGVCFYFRHSFIWAGPAIVLLLFAEFVAAYVLAKLKRAGT
jgi:manganese transport system permease protein